ncbi:serine/arginine repetitive matrix protein 1-like [Gallus gallus]|uniref:serine/arginine repetitive matrix protein 1-like n=1 Tax=Gallus gallus TaxID=9031 RepID=UPI001AE5E1A1|nr:serine/arginine repetitive matrix protein 1-like [Gallus gallus]
MAAAPPRAPRPLTEEDRREVRGRATAGKKLSGPSGHPRAAPAPPPPHRPSRLRAGGRRGWAERRALPRPHRRRPSQVARRERCPLAMPHPSRRGAAPRQRPPAGPAEPLSLLLRAVRGCRGWRPDSEPLLGDGAVTQGNGCRTAAAAAPPPAHLRPPAAALPSHGPPPAARLRPSRHALPRLGPPCRAC